MKCPKCEKGHMHLICEICQHIFYVWDKELIEEELKKR